MEILSQHDHVRVAEAIRLAEERTAGEIYCVVARTSGSYFSAAAFMLAIAMLTVSLVIAFILERWWLDLRLPVFVAAQIAAYACALAVLRLFPDICRRLVPRRIQYRQAHENALKQFLARNVHITRERTGILLFLSLAERYAAVVADAGIDQRVSQERWDAAVGALIEGAKRGLPADGFLAAIDQVGALLAEHFPSGAENPNELDDHLVEL